jgi:hypothetical protein
MFERVEDIIKRNMDPYVTPIDTIPSDSIEKEEFYLTHPSFNTNKTVKLGAKLVLKDGSVLGNIIRIPLSTLKELIKQ